MSEAQKSDLFCDPNSPKEKAAAESLLKRIVQPFSDIEVMHVDKPKPIETVRYAEVIPLARRAVENIITTENEEHNKEERKAV